MGRRRRRQRRHYKHYEDQVRSSQRRYRSSRARGWGLNLYRNTRDGKIAGVCAGLADHWDCAHWVMRLIWVAALFFTGFLAFWAYVAAWILLAPKRQRRFGDADSAYQDDDLGEDLEMEYDERTHSYQPRRVFRYSESSSVRLKRARERLDAALRQVEDMESYVTSRQYTLDKEFSRL